MTTVQCVGIAVLDYLFTMEALPPTSGKYYATDYREIGGGVAANAAAAVVVLGGNARYVGRVGDDAAGERIVSDLADLGVDVAGVDRVAQLSSPVSAVLVDKAGERTIINYTESSLFDGGETSMAAELEGVDAVLVDVRWPAGADAALAAASAAHIPSVFDFDRPMADGGTDLMRAATHVAFSQAALAATSGSDDPATGLQTMSSKTDAWLAVTAGAEGVWWLDGGDVRHLAAFDVPVVDTVGAGDVFHGALALSLGEGRAEAEAVRFAAAAAALKCTKPGGRAGAPTRPEVEALLEGEH